MKAIILARVSTAEQREAGNSLPSQLFRLDQYAHDRGLEILHRYEFDESAYKSRRETFARVMKLIRGHREPLALCCDKVDRLMRNFTRDLVTLEDWRRTGKVELHFPSDGLVLHKDSPATDLFRFTIGVSLAKYYSDSIRDNVRRAFDQKLRNGEWIGPPRVGYMLVRDAQGQRDHVPDPAKAHLIARVFEQYATGTNSIKTIHQEMLRAGLTGTKGKPLARSMIAHILQDRFYCGVMVSRGVEYPHKYERLVTPALFARCEEVRRSWGRTPSKRAGRPFVFRGLIRCARCGCSISPEVKKERLVYYSCTNAKGACKRIYVPERALLAPVLDVLAKLELPEETADELVAALRTADRGKSAFHHLEVTRLQREYDRLQARLDQLPALLLDGLVTREVYEAKLREWRREQSDTALQLEAYANASEDYLVTLGRVLELGQKARSVFERSEIDEKRRLLAFLLQNAELDGRKLRFELKTPFDLIAGLHGRPIGLPELDTFRTVNWKQVRFELSLTEVAA